MLEIRATDLKDLGKGLDDCMIYRVPTYRVTALNTGGTVKYCINGRILLGVHDQWKYDSHVHHDHESRCLELMGRVRHRMLVVGASTGPAGGRESDHRACAILVLPRILYSNIMRWIVRYAATASFSLMFNE